MSDPREELRNELADLDTLSLNASGVIADRLIAAGYRKLSDLASDPAVIERVAKQRHEDWRESLRMAPDYRAPWEEISEHARADYCDDAAEWLGAIARAFGVVAALAATPENSQ